MGAKRVVLLTSRLRRRGRPIQLEVRERLGPFAPVTLQVPAGHIYVRGDNRGNSHDSHSFGPVAVDQVLGRARAIFLPLERFGPLE